MEGREADNGERERERERETALESDSTLSVLEQDQNNNKPSQQGSGPFVSGRLRRYAAEESSTTPWPDITSISSVSADSWYVSTSTFKHPLCMHEFENGASCTFSHVASVQFGPKALPKVQSPARRPPHRMSFPWIHPC